MATQVFQSLLMWVRSNLSLWMMVIKCIVVKFMPTFNFRLQGPSVQPILKTSSLFYRTFTESTQDHQYLAWEFLWEGKAFLITVKPPVSNHPKCEALVAAYRRLCLRESNHRGSLPTRSPNPTPFLERMYCMRFLGYNTSNNKRLLIAGNNDWRSKSSCSSAVLFISFTWQIAKMRVIRLRVIEAPNVCVHMAFCAFHSFLVEVQVNVITTWRSGLGAPLVTHNN